MSADPWRVELTRAAMRDLRRLDPQIRRRVEAALTNLATDPTRPGALRKLSGAPEHRLRIGDWRVRFSRDRDSRRVEVLRVLPRGPAYRD